jgi:hypothetical protein
MDFPLWRKAKNHANSNLNYLYHCHYMQPYFRIIKGIAVVFFAFLIQPQCMGQYTDDARDRSRDTVGDSSGNGNPKPFINLKDKGLAGTEFMLTASTGVFYAELSPFVGIRPVRPIILGAGVHGSYLGAYSQSNTYYGVYGFGRIVIADMLFLHAEYRLLNGHVPGSRDPREWVSSPIFALGLAQGTSAYVMFGYAMNQDFQQINPFGSFVYRFGFYF